LLDDHYLYAYTTDGEERCLITIPQSVGMSRVDGFYITHENTKAYIVDSQGHIYEGDEGRLGGSVYQVDWTNPCGCTSDGSCSSTSATWTPTVTQSWSISASDVSGNEGGGNDEYFRNSGIVVVGDSWYGVNGVHPIAGGSLTSSYTKSIVEMSMTSSSIVTFWSFDGSSVGYDVDMEGLTCGPDMCASTLYVGDEYNYIYALDLESGQINMEWDLNSMVGSVRTDKGIESLTYASTPGYYYAGIQDTAEIHVVRLDTTTAPTMAPNMDADPNMAPTKKPSEDESCGLFNHACK
jgi:hypothetical protein